MVRIGVGLEWVARSLSMSFIPMDWKTSYSPWGETSHRQPK